MRRSKIKKIIIFCIGTWLYFVCIKYFHIHEKFFQFIDAAQAGQNYWETAWETAKAVLLFITSIIPLLTFARLVIKDIMEKLEKRPKLSIRIKDVSIIRKQIKKDLQEIVFGDKNWFIYADALIENNGKCKIKTCTINEEKLRTGCMKPGDGYLFRFRITTEDVEENFQDSYPLVLKYQVAENIYYEELLRMKININEFTGEIISEKKRKKRGRCD